MPDSLGELLTRWTIRLALACYAFCFAAAIARGRHETGRWEQVVRVVWTLGCGLFIAHVIAAFGFYHHFSHQAAYDDTAQQTEQLLGFSFGGGIYFSYLFLVLWIADVIWRWVAPAARPAWLNWPLHTYMFFIAFNGAIIFEGGFSRVAGIGACLLLAGIAIWRILQQRRILANAPAGD